MGRGFLTWDKAARGWKIWVMKSGGWGVRGGARLKRNIDRLLLLAGG
jgi:hypothetical protein